MSNKQIIIDGVNIKDCKRRIGKDNYCRYYKRPCSENNFNCIWKKYLRKEQENKKLKEDEKSLLNIIDDLQKEKNKWVEKYNDLGQDFDQLKQTLTEIKEIAKNMNEECFYDDFDCMNCDMQNGCTYFNKKQILQKNSEVENDNA